MKEQVVKLHEDQEYIKLGSLLKFCGVIDRGSDEKTFLNSSKIIVGDHTENRRGAKIRDGDIVKVNDDLIIKVCK